jgi:nucleotide-binding universal stress UspA family protein
MLRSLLVPLDGSDLSERSLPLAAQVARATGAQLHLAHVHVPYEPDDLISNTSFQWEGVDLAEYDAHHLEREKEYLARLEAEIGGDGMAVDWRVLAGPAIAEDLATYADEVHTDMIFIASHGRSGVKRAWWGSVADELIRRTTLPLLVLHPQGRKKALTDVLAVRHILVPLDGSNASASVLGPASDLARATGARLTLLTVVSTPNSMGRRMVSPKPPETEPEVEEAWAYLEELASGLRDSGLDVSVHATHDKAPASAIKEVARRLDADLIAMATHGYGGLKRSLLGSVADKLSKSSSLPLLVVRPSLEA